MKKLIVLLAAMVLIPGMALAETVNVFGDGDIKQIYVTDDSGYLRTYTSQKVGDYTTIIWDNQTGLSTTVHDFSSHPEPVEQSDYFETPDLLD